MEDSKMLAKKSIIIIAIMATLLMWMPLKAKNSGENMMLSPGKARNYSLFATVAPMAGGTALMLADPDGHSGIGGLGLLLFWTGGTFGPGTGYLYAHHPWGFWRGVIIRTIGIGGVTAAMAISWDNYDAPGAWELFIAGSILYVGSGIFDIYNSAISAKNYNRERGLSLKIKPCYIASKKAPGLMLSVGF